LAISVVASGVLRLPQDGPISYQERSAWSGIDVIAGARPSARSVISSLVKGLPKKPHATPPAGILSVWQIKENPVSNDL